MFHRRIFLSLKSLHTPMYLKCLHTPRYLKCLRTHSHLKNLRTLSNLKRLRSPRYLKRLHTPKYLKSFRNPSILKNLCTPLYLQRTPRKDCCFDGQSCYFGKGVTVQCTKDGYFIVVVAKDVTLPHIDLETISLLGGGHGCTHVDSNSLFAIYFFPITACGTVVMEEPGVIVYENRMTSSYEVGVGPLGAITRDSSYELLFQCRYIGTSVETVVVELLPLDNPPLSIAALGPIRVALRLANGHCLTKGCNEVDAAYTSYYVDSDYPVTKVLRDPVYVEVLLLEKTDPALVLTLGRCWATTDTSPHSLPQWDILIDGCPYVDDRYLSSLVPVDASSGLNFPTHYQRFIFKMFTFVDTKSMEPLKENVYIHCSTAVCVSGPGVSCEPSCNRKGRRDTEAAEQRKAEPKIVVSSGEVIMIAPQE
ncbi:hypothetical protein ILYODFUR_022032 [Ilyodon furcidens]|uniref:ZP domain-containing protein n=1 Tax=Ilyodon furcidens TaxID=33524 RepID=A0ABV0TX73_9TELE